MRSLDQILFHAAAVRREMLEKRFDPERYEFFVTPDEALLLQRERLYDAGAKENKLMGLPVIINWPNGNQSIASVGALAEAYQAGFQAGRKRSHES